jgi:cell wall-associated NlpC family hydrolase
LAWPGAQVPNFSDWQEGDIVLVHRAQDAIGIAIQALQAASLSPVTRAGSLCSHAAIYIGDGMVVDATPAAGVSAQSIWNYCQTRSIQVRRLSEPSIPEFDIANIATLARQHVGEPYSVIQAILSKLFPGTLPIPNALYCSTLVGLVIADATGVDLSSDPVHQPLHPGTLAAHPDLMDVLLEWRSS